MDGVEGDVQYRVDPRVGDGPSAAEDEVQFVPELGFSVRHSSSFFLFLFLISELKKREKKEKEKEKERRWQLAAS